MDEDVSDFGFDFPAGIVRLFGNPQRHVLKLAFVSVEFWTACGDSRYPCDDESQVHDG